MTMLQKFRALPTWAKIAIVGGAYYGAKHVYDHLTEKNIRGEVVVITGGASGIGRLVALLLAKQGCRIALWDVHQENLSRVASEISMIVGAENVRTYVSDVSDRENVYATAKRTLADFGRVDMLINNAGIVAGKNILEVNDNMAEKVMAVNATAHFWTVKAFLPYMIERNHGHLITLASAAGFNGVPDLADYCASKFAAVGFHESIRLMLTKMGKPGVKTSLVCPYFINTGMFTGAKTRFPLLLPILEPDYVAQKIVTAIRRDQEWLALPWIVYVTPLFRSLLPVKVVDSISTFLGIADSMNDFKQTRTHTLTS